MADKGIKYKGGFLFSSTKFEGEKIDELENIREPRFQRKDRDRFLL